MKKFISCILFFVMLMSVCSLGASAVSFEGMAALKAQFKSGVTDELDYVCYSPLKSIDF